MGRIADEASCGLGQQLSAIRFLFLVNAPRQRLRRRRRGLRGLASGRFRRSRMFRVTGMYGGFVPLLAISAIAG